MSRTHSRRAFLGNTLGGSSLVALGSCTIPGFLAASARAARIENDQRILVVIQLLGGNDGLNTVVPFGMDGYERNRRALRVAASQVHRLNDTIGLHPSLNALARLVDEQSLAIVQGVGYPNPDRSHFRSMEIWETARIDNEPGALDSGWLGRVLDQKPAEAGADLPAINLSGYQGLALKARRSQVPTIRSIEEYRLRLAGDADRDALRQATALRRAGEDSLAGFVQRCALAAYDSSGRLESILDQESGATSYPDTALGRRLRQIAQIIQAGFGTRIYYTAQEGYDTHAGQLAVHDALLREFGDALGAFLGDLKSAGQSQRVAVLAFSEFGRRVPENASAGTDHGAAAPVFLAGPVTQAGLIGAHPSLEDLDDGDLKFHTDFRQVYASLLERWLRVPAAGILGQEFAPLELLPV